MTSEASRAAERERDRLRKRRKREKAEAAKRALLPIAKTSARYRSMMPVAPELTKLEMRRVIEQAVINTAALAAQQTEEG
jgi:hypothetical protein